MFQRFTAGLALSLLVSISAFGQGQPDIGKLQTRVSEFWQFRKDGDRLRAVEYIESETRNVFLQQVDKPVFKFEFAGLNFVSGNLNEVDVNVKVESFIGAGVGDRVVTDRWIWKDGQWYMRAVPPPDPYASQTRPFTPKEPEFRLKTATVDIGKRVQGANVEGKIDFAASFSEIRTVRLLERIPGLVIGGPVWINNSEGYLPYQWEMTLLSQSVDKTIKLEAISRSEGRTVFEVRFQAQIAGKIAFKQVPEVVDPSKNGQVELQIQNLMTNPLKILGVNSLNPAYVVDESSITETIEAGKTGRMVIRYVGQLEPTGASLSLVLSEALTPSGITTVPLNIFIPEPVRQGDFTPDQIKQLCQQNGVVCGGPVR